MIASSASIVGDLGVFPLTAVKFVIGRAFVARADAEQRAEGVKRVEPAVKAERELIEVGLQMLRADPVMTPRQPALCGCQPDRHEC